MKPLMKFNRVYFLLTIVLFVIEILIASFAHDRFIRPYVGDILVVMLLYCFARSFLQIPFLVTSIVVLVISYLIETLQYFHFIERVGLGKAAFARIVFGTSFAWADLLAYTIGIVIVIYIETLFAKSALKQPF
jgi:hypothetical protein